MADDMNQSGGQREWKPVEATATAGSASGTDNKAAAKNMLSQIEAFLEEYMVKKAPFQIPMNIKEIIVKIAPYLIIIFAVLFVPVLLAALGLSAVLAPFAMMGGAVTGGVSWGLWGIISLVTGIAAFGLEIFAVPGLFKRTQGAWRLVYWASLVSFVGGVLNIYGLIGTIIGSIIGWYILFQVKELYKN
ncbi:MAG: hypothetical protein ABI747_03435 [Candidatus Moraniibacteriota bacterium]